MVCTVGSGSAAEMQAYMDGDWRPLMTKGVAGRRGGGSGQVFASRVMTEVEVGPLAWAMGGVVTSGNGLQVPVAGLYSIDGMFRWYNDAGPTSEAVQMRLMVNGETVAIQQNQQAMRYSGVATVYPLQAGDVVTMRAYNYGEPVTLSASSGDPHLTVALIARTS